MPDPRCAPVLRMALVVWVMTAMGVPSPDASAEPANPTGVAVIIGNANYEHRDVPAVDFAHRDAEAFRRYVVDVLGYDPANVIEFRDASRRELIDVFGTRSNPEGLLWSYLDPAVGSEVVVFYSGHGVPGTDDGRGYLLPVDADPNTAEEDGYPVDLLYRNVGGLAEARSVRVYLDACFSGGSHDGRSLIRNASPVYVAATLPEEVAGKVTGLAAASGEQVASWDEAAGHGLFTHHLLDALYGGGDADGDGRVTAAEAKAHLDRHMTRAARRQHRRIQEASLVGEADAVLASAGDGGAFPARPEVPGTASAYPPPSASTAEPSLTVEQNKYLLGLKMAFEAQDYPKVLEFADRLEALGGGLPAEAEFFRGEAEFQVGRFAAAARSLERYVAAADRDDPNYRRALEGLLALEEADDAAYTRAEAAGTSASFGEYLELFPRGRHVEEARERESALQAEEAERRRIDEERRAAERRADDEAFAEARRLHTPLGYLAYLGRGGRHVAEAEALLAEVSVFRDCESCPEMVVVPAGSFMMGSLASEKGRRGDEGPQRRVTISHPFAVGTYEVTFAEWDACVRDGGCSHRPNDMGWGRGRRPVINVSWNDAQSYVRWLSRETGKAYRLLTEAEWEYAARAGSTGPFYFGETISTDQANYDGREVYGAGRKGVYRERTAPVGSFSPNGFGLRDMHGNVWEWVEDCWHGSYSGAPSDGSAWTSGGDCSKRVLRGGAWSSGPETLRSANRDKFDSSCRNYSCGFRVARTLTP